MTENINHLYQKLIDKSLDSFILSLEIYNRPTLKNKVESFALLNINAWELLLKALIIKDSNQIKTISYKNSEKTISISVALRKLYNENSIIRKRLCHLNVLVSSVRWDSASSPETHASAWLAARQQNFINTNR